LRRERKRSRASGSWPRAAREASRRSQRPCDRGRLRADRRARADSCDNHVAGEHSNRAALDTRTDARSWSTAAGRAHRDDDEAGLRQASRASMAGPTSSRAGGMRETTIAIIGASMVALCRAPRAKAGASSSVAKPCRIDVLAGRETGRCELAAAASAAFRLVQAADFAPRLRTRRPRRDRDSGQPAPGARRARLPK